MPRIISRTPRWLDHNTPGFDLFSSRKQTADRPGQQHASSDRRRPQQPYRGPHQRLACRKTEIFVAVGSTVRWADLRRLKDAWEGQDYRRSLSKAAERSDTSVGNGFLDDSRHRTLEVKEVFEPIRQLSISPNGRLLAIVTAHTARIVILPDSSLLDQPDTGPIKVKTFTLGPTAHVLSQPRIVSALWHPLGVHAACLITVTADAVVRVWELSRDDKMSFNEPSLELDLRKLRYASSAEDDFSAPKMGRNRGFSIDHVEMEVSAATFGGAGAEGESGWSPMTLWIAMTEGDVYALCPLLPSKWQSSASLVPALMAAATAGKCSTDGSDSADEKRMFQEQYEWLAELENQDVVPGQGDDSFGPGSLIYRRPTAPGSIPQLQGPFDILPEEVEEDLEICGIHVIAPKSDIGEVSGADDDEADDALPEPTGISTSVVCLLTIHGRVYICLDLQGVGPQWIPPKKPHARLPPKSKGHQELVVLESLDTLRNDGASDVEWPAFSPNPYSKYSFFVTHSQGLYFFSLEPWLDILEDELQSESDEGAQFRATILSQAAGTFRERLIRTEQHAQSNPEAALVTPVVLLDDELGYFLLTAHGDRPQAIVMDNPRSGTDRQVTIDIGRDYKSEARMISAGPPRPTYEIPDVFQAELSLSSFFDRNVEARHRKSLKEEIRLSSATLEVMTNAHRTLSAETYKLGVSAADLFRRCERLLDEFRNQIHRANDVAGRIDQLNDEDADDFEPGRAKGKARTEERLQKIKERHERLSQKHEALKRKLARLGGKPLSDKERAWIAELEKMQTSILPAKEDGEVDGRVNNGDGRQEPWERLEEAKTLARGLVPQIEDVSGTDGEEAVANGNPKLPANMRKTRMAEVSTLLEREAALVDAAQEKLGRLGLLGAG